MVVVVGGRRGRVGGHVAVAVGVMEAGRGGHGGAVQVAVRQYRVLLLLLLLLRQMPVEESYRICLYRD